MTEHGKVGSAFAEPAFRLSETCVQGGTFRRRLAQAAVRCGP